MNSRTSIFSLLLLISCEKLEIPTTATDTDQEQTASAPTLILQTDSDQWYLSATRYTGLIGQSAFQSAMMGVPQPYRVPTKAEGETLRHHISAPSERLLCLTPDSVWYTFTSGGSVTKAGQKTKYTLWPIYRRSIRQDTIYIDIWQ